MSNAMPSKINQATSKKMSFARSAFMITITSQKMKPPNVRVQVARAVARNPRRTKPVEKHAIPRSPATNCSAALYGPSANASGARTRLRSREKLQSLSQQPSECLPHTLKKELGSIGTDCCTDYHIGQCANCEVDPVPSAYTTSCIDDLVKLSGDVVDLFRRKVLALPNSIVDRFKALSNARNLGRCEGIIGGALIWDASR